MFNRTVFCDPRKPHENETSPELQNISGTGNTFRSHYWADQDWTEKYWHNNTYTVLIHQTHRTEVFSGCAPLHPSCHSYEMSRYVQRAVISWFRLIVNADMSNRTQKQIPKLIRFTNKTKMCDGNLQMFLVLAPHLHMYLCAFLKSESLHLASRASVKTIVTPCVLGNIMSLS